MQNPQNSKKTARAVIIGIPFRNVEEAWFWFICAVEARRDGAVPGRGRGAVPRPCEPNDIYVTLERLYRNRRLRMEHMHVLSHYGRRRMPPEYHRRHEARAATLWREAMRELDVMLQRRGIVRNPLQITEVL
ncbi:MAG TPA: hypothetical protein PKW15_08190 [Alphaproteobacteria bacterium]|nr:hypothetical protein [Rhodospirillaceae bacterium]HRJ13204.1 hypothetical protein [Alphaproteobacteria bacterium]